MKATTIDKLWPRETVARVRAVSKSDFLRDADGPLLLVRVDDVDGELASVLRRGALGERAPTPPAIGFRTTTRVGDEPSTRLCTPFDARRLELRLALAPHVAVPLRKRVGSGKEFIERVSVGRAMNNDIVLRHESVSKVHSWFVRDEEHESYGADAGSRNKTLLNGEALGTLVPVKMASGDTLRFGAVDAIICSPALFWEAVRAS
jgi:hypothetical protein